LLDWREDTRPLDWTSIRRPETVVVVGVDDPKARAGLLGAGFGDALDTQVALVELAARLVKLEAFSRSMPRKRKAGPVTLDLFYRDGRVDGSWLGLHPREFALLWRLAETPYSPVSRRQLLADVWRMDHLPETNSLEVHVSRLRAKLAISRCGWLVQTHPDGGYQLGGDAHGGFRAFAGARREMLDRGGTFGNGGRVGTSEEGIRHAVQRTRFD
jgi:DNA-binding response OmpR family regulator